MDIVDSEEKEEVLDPGAIISLHLENTSPASHYFITVDTGTAGQFPQPYAHRIVGETPQGENQFDGTGRARALAYSMPSADFVTLEIQNITDIPADTIISEPKEENYRIRLYAVSFN